MTRSQPWIRTWFGRPAALAVLTAAGLLTGPAAADGQPLASLLRVTMDGAPADAATVTSYGVETMLIEALQDFGLRTVDLTPLHADFQVLRYDTDCPVVDGGLDYTDCAQFGNYANAALDVLTSIDEAVRYKVLNGFGRDDYVLIGDASIKNTKREVIGEMHYRVHRLGASEIVLSGTVPLTSQVGTAPRDGAQREVFDRMIYRAAQQISEKLP